MRRFDGVAEYNQLKVIKAMQEARVSDIHFAGTTGYGYNDLAVIPWRRYTPGPFTARTPWCAPS